MRANEEFRNQISKFEIIGGPVGDEPLTSNETRRPSDRYFALQDRILGATGPGNTLNWAFG
jgi:hypothetical protein